MNQPENGMQQPRIVESASASTACQTNESKFAYILTGGILGVIALLAIAIILLVFAAIGSWNSYERDRSWEDYANPPGVPKLTVSRAPGQSNSGGNQAPKKIR